MTLIQSLPAFVDDVGSVLSHADLSAMRDNVALIDSLSFRRGMCFDSSAANFTNTPGYYGGSGNDFGYWRVWKGAIRWQAGVTAIHVNGFAKRSTGGSETLTVYANGVSLGTITPATGAGATFSFNVGFTGYADGQVIVIEIRITGSSWNGDGRYIIHGIYVDPVDATAGTYGGVPTFAGTYNAARLNQLVDAYLWLYNRMALVPMVAQIAQIYNLGPFNIAGNIEAGKGAPIYYGAVLRAYTEDKLTIGFYLENESTTGVRYKVYLNGSLAATGPTWGPGYYFANQVISLSGISVGTKAEVAIYTEVVTENTNRTLWKFNYWHILYVHAEPDTTAGEKYPYATLPAAPAGDSSVSTATLDAFLNALCTTLTAAKARIDGAPGLWARSYAMHERYSRGDSHTNPVTEQHRARPRIVRLSDRLYVSGKDVKLGYGAITVPIDDKGKQYDQYTHQNEVGVIDGDKVQTTTVYLDSVDGLYPGTAYFVVGDVRYAAEIL